MSEARKFGLNLVVANQFTTQLSEEVRSAVFGNVGTIISLRVGIDDAEFLAKQFAPIFDSDDLQRIPNYNAVVRTLINGVPTQPFSMAGLPPLDVKNTELADALKQLTAAKYGRSKAVVEKEIMERISVAPAASGPVGGMPAGNRPAKPSTGSSFLDDWMQKKQTNAFKTPSSPFNAPPPKPQPNQAPHIPQNSPSPATQPNIQTYPAHQTPYQPTTAVQTNQTFNQPAINQSQLQSQPLSPQEKSNEPQKPTQETDNSVVNLNNPHTNDHTVNLR
jgi:hypothetical protein